MKRKYLLIIWLAITIGCSQKQTMSAVQATGEVDKISLTRALEKIYQKSKLPGFTLVIVDDLGVKYQQSLGYADVATRTPYTGDTVQNIGSISKTLIAVALLKAVEQGYVDLDRPINDYLNFQVIHPQHPAHAITLRHLATHTSGLSDQDEIYNKSYVLTGQQERQYSEETQSYLDLIKHNELVDDAVYLQRTLSADGRWYSDASFHADPPGQTYAYSNIGAALAALVIEQAVGMPYEAYTQKHIFAPLQMVQTGWNDQAYQPKNQASRYFASQELVPGYQLITRADGGLFTSSSDFAKYLVEMLRGAQGKGTLLTPGLYQQMYTRQTYGAGEHGIFWEINAQNRPNHSGGDPGIVALTILYPEQNKGYFFMTNISADEDEKLFASVRRVLKSMVEHS